MILKYRTYSHPVSEASIVISMDPQRNERGVWYATREKWTIDGLLQADTQALLTTAIEDLEAGYGVDGGDLTLFLPDGTTETAHKIKSADTIGGTRVTLLTYPEGKGAEYSTFRTYRLEVEADMRIGDGPTLLFWDEVLNFTGNTGPRFGYLDVLNGLPQKQLLHQRTTQKVSQSGRAVGHFGYPLYAAPIWPAAEHLDQRRTTKKLPQRRGSGAAASDVSYEVTWEYAFESNVPLIGNPTPHV